jgi:hypothetical protein
MVRRFRKEEIKSLSKITHCFEFGMDLGVNK